MEIKYSKKEFEGYTHRFIVMMRLDNDGRNITIYSNSGSTIKLHNFINERKSEKVLGFEILHKSSKQEDEDTSKFIDEIITAF